MEMAERNKSEPIAAKKKRGRPPKHPDTEKIDLDFRVQQPIPPQVSKQKPIEKKD